MTSTKGGTCLPPEVDTDYSIVNSQTVFSEKNPMKQWMKKFLQQFESDPHNESQLQTISEDRATLLYFLDIYSKNVFEIDTQPVRKVRETLDDFAKSLIHQDPVSAEKTLFRLRQFFSAYRIEEYTFVQKTFEDFKAIVWDFADQLSEDLRFEAAKGRQMNESLHQLREAVESNSIEVLRSKSREFIDLYIEYSTHKEVRQERTLTSMKKNLKMVQKQLVAANQAVHEDHLTGAFNRRSFDEQLKNHVRLFDLSKVPVSIILFDIDHFKKINDNYGHDVGDFVLKECVQMLKGIFSRPQDVLARIGGEEFAVILPEYQAEHAVKKAEVVLKKVLEEVFVHGEQKLQFTVSMGIAQLQEHEKHDQWLKKADVALYHSKRTGRNRYTVWRPELSSIKVA